MTIKYQLWICKTNNWIMIGFFWSEAEAMVKYHEIEDSATTAFEVIRVDRTHGGVKQHD